MQKTVQPEYLLKFNSSYILLHHTVAILLRQPRPSATQIKSNG